MKNKLTLAILFLVAICIGQQAKAQTPIADVTATDPVTVNIDLTTPVLSIKLGADPTVNFKYTTADEYTKDKEEKKTGHFTVISNTPYDIAVKALGEFTSTSSGNLPLSLVTVNIDAATANGGTLTGPQALVINSEQTLATEASPSIGAVYNVNYSIPDASTLITLANEIYTTTVIYTVTQN